MTSMEEIRSSMTAEDAKRMEVAKRNRAVILAALAAAGVAQVVANYSGSGDSGAFDAFAFRKEAEEVEEGCADDVARADLGEAEAVDVSAIKVTVEYVGFNAKPLRSPEEVMLQEAVERLFDDHLEALHGGWENNDGGEGQFVWTIATDHLALVHRDFYIQSDRSDHEL